MKKDMFEKEFSHSFGVYSFSTRSENYPLRKTMVDHNHERVISKRGRVISDQVNRQLLEQAGADRGNRRERGDGQVGIDLHLLAEGAASNKMANKGRHTQPPVVLRQ